jgi:hypothetical protein
VTAELEEIYLWWQEEKESYVNDATGAGGLYL